MKLRNVFPYLLASAVVSSVCAGVIQDPTKLREESGGKTRLNLFELANDDVQFPIASVTVFDYFNQIVSNIYSSVEHKGPISLDSFVTNSNLRVVLNADGESSVGAPGFVDYGWGVVVSEFSNVTFQMREGGNPGLNTDALFGQTVLAPALEIDSNVLKKYDVSFSDSSIGSIDAILFYSGAVENYGVTKDLSIEKKPNKATVVLIQ